MKAEQLASRIFFSPSAGCSPHIRVKDDRGKDIREKVCQFKQGKYFALPANESELETDEYPLLKKHPDYGVWIFTQEDWAARGLDEMDKNHRGAIESTILQQAQENQELRKQLEQSKTGHIDPKVILEKDAQIARLQKMLESQNQQPNVNTKGKKGKK